MSILVHELIADIASRTPQALALREANFEVDYATLATQVEQAANLFLSVGLACNERIAVYMDKRIDHVIALFGAAAAGGVFVPVNPQLKAEQVAHILRDCNVRILVTTLERIQLLSEVLATCHDLRTIVVVSEKHYRKCRG